MARCNNDAAPEDVSSILDAHYRRARDELVQVALALTGDLDVAQDVVQDVFAGLLERLPRNHDGRQLYGYLRVAVRNRSLNRLRDQGRRRELWEQILPRYPGRSPDEARQLNELRDSLNKCLGMLSACQRAVLEKIYLEGLSYSEAARECSVPVDTIRKRLYRGRQHLRTCMGSTPWGTRESKGRWGLH